jgi:hypothetical protein
MLPAGEYVRTVIACLNPDPGFSVALITRRRGFRERGERCASPHLKQQEDQKQTTDGLYMSSHRFHVSHSPSSLSMMPATNSVAGTTESCLN